MKLLRRRPDPRPEIGALSHRARGVIAASLSLAMLAASGCAGDEPSDGGLSCGAGTMEVDGACVPADPGPGPGVTCGAGTEEVDGACVPAGPGVS